MDERYAMSTMIIEVYQAFRSVGIDEEKAQKAAQAISSESVATKGDIVAMEKRLSDQYIKLDKEVVVMKWMLAVIMAATVLPLLKGSLL
jgi:hypothetical protein